MKKLFVTLATALVLLASCSKTDNDPRLVIITFDGLRWQELFSGADESLVANERFVKNTAALKAAYWRETPEQRREALMPFVWSYVPQHGYLIGNREKNSLMQVDNEMSFSYPGYSEMFCGWSDDDRINSNDPVPNPNVSVLEVVNQDPRYKGKVMMYSSWESIRFAVNNERGGFKGSSAHEPSYTDTPTAKLLQDVDAGVPDGGFGGGERLDCITYGLAMETLKAEHPKVFYVGFGDTDEFAHSGEYDHYLEAIHWTDLYIRRIVEFCESDPFYKGKTTYLMTTDHGRGNKGAFTDHGTGTRGSAHTWMLAFGKGIKRLGETSANGPFYTRQFAATIADILGIDFTPGNGEKQSPVDPEFKGEPLDDNMSVKDMGYFHEMGVKPKGSGLKYKYYEGPFVSVDELLTSGYEDSGIVNGFNIDGAKADDHFGFDFHGYIKIPVSGRYVISVASDDGTKVFIDDKLVIDNDGSHSVNVVEASLAMDAGFHRIQVLYFDDTEGQSLDVGIQGCGISYENIPGSMLFH